MDGVGKKVSRGRQVSVECASSVCVSVCADLRTYRTYRTHWTFRSAGGRIRKRKVESGDGMHVNLQG